MSAAFLWVAISFTWRKSLCFLIFYLGNFVDGWEQGQWRVGRNKGLSKICKGRLCLGLPFLFSFNSNDLPAHPIFLICTCDLCYILCFLGNSALKTTVITFSPPKSLRCQHFLVTLPCLHNVHILCSVLQGPLSDQIANFSLNHLSQLCICITFWEAANVPHVGVPRDLFLSLRSPPRYSHPVSRL